ncbi:flagellar biosynthesis repressor FlbT [Sphingomonas sp. PAMC 26617]|uniref:flagellar biosynthesis repressor FlbT n=1 Tax=Sphingomonas sp. PAMC 26617 TaxID=1112216 RepID=UPI000287C29E|nr:flagellar biosynthesis repressor FlbT [Sphingomonas sp. PAMC 26617]
MRSFALDDGETMIVNGATLRAPFACDLLIDPDATVLRGDDLMTPDQATTPARQLYVACLAAYCGHDRVAQHHRIIAALQIVLAGQTDDAARAVSVRFANAVAARDYVRGLAECRTLIAQEDGPRGAMLAA